MQKHKIYRMGIEINGLGNALPEIMRRVADKHNLQINIVQIANHTKKETRILNTIEPLLGAGRIFAHTRIQQTPFMSEMLGWSPIGGIGHDDGLDAFCGAINTLPIPIRPSNHTMRPFTANTNFKI